MLHGPQALTQRVTRPYDTTYYIRSSECVTPVAINVTSSSRPYVLSHGVQHSTRQIQRNCPEQVQTAGRSRNMLLYQNQYCHVLQGYALLSPLPIYPSFNIPPRL